ncbi:MAG: HD-GYP domain-containing protein [Coriobacteriia bacterium]
MNQNLGHVMKREGQLQTLAYIVIISLLAVVGFLLFALVTGVQLPDLWLVRNDIARTLVPGLLLMVILYMVDQHQRLRHRLMGIHKDLECTTLELQASVDRLSFAHRASEIMTSLTAENGLERVLREALDRFGADAAALVTDDVHIVARDGVSSGSAHLAVEQAAMQAVRAGMPQSFASAHGRTHALAVPLRVDAKLTSVFCVWRREGSFSEEDMAGIQLVAHIVEMSLENHDLLERTRTQLHGTLMTLAELVGARQPEYVQHSSRVADYAVSVGILLGLTADEIADLRIAAILHDVGMLEVPLEIISASRSLTASEEQTIHKHTVTGARIVQTARLNERVQQAVLSHHERIDGSGYPYGLRGDSIPLAARIIGACDAYAAMCSERPHRPALTERQAFAELRRTSGVLFDARVVSALEGVTGNGIQSRAVFGPELTMLLDQVS